jgi:serine/threonine protein kinase
MEANTAILLSDYEEIGSGSFGKVYIGTSKNERYAVKRRYVCDNSPPGCVHVGEIDSLHRFRHPNILRAKVIQRRNPIDDNFRVDKLNTYGDDRGHTYRADLAYVLTEAADSDLWGRVKEPQSIEAIRRWMWQILSGIEYIHAKGFIHRDIKPHNILYFKKDDSIKICDFDMCMPDIPNMLSFKAMTPEYTPPEILTQGSEVLYTKKVDIWGAGLIMKFLTVGDSIVKRGDRKDRDMDNYIIALQKKFFPNGDHIELDMSFVNLSKDNIEILTHDSDMDDLIYHMLDCNPDTRWTATQCLNHRFFGRHSSMPDIPTQEDFIMETHYISNDMVKVFDSEINSMDERTWFGFFLGLDIMARVCRTKYSGDAKKLAICCFNIGMKYFDKETAKTIPIGAEDAKTIEYRIIVEKLRGEVYRDTIYNHIQEHPLRLYGYLVSAKIFPRKFSELRDGIIQHFATTTKQ